MPGGSGRGGESFVLGTDGWRKRGRVSDVEKDGGSLDAGRRYLVSGRRPRERV